MKLTLNPLFRRVSWGRLARIMRELRPYLRDVRREVLVASIASTGAVAMAIARPWPIKVVLDYALLPDQRVKWVYPYNVLKGYGPMGVVTIASALLLIIGLLWAVFTYLELYNIAAAGQRVTFAIRRRLFSHLQRLSLGFHRREHMGDLMLRATSDVNMMRDMMVDAVKSQFKRKHLDKPWRFQRDGWDTRLRRSESYTDKWNYTRENPVRRGLVSKPEVWPFWGMLNELRW